MKGQYDEKYLRKCHKRLRELGAPLENWSCIEVEDGETADFICELCGCDRVRFIHVMAHAEYDGVLQVGEQGIQLGLAYFADANSLVKEGDNLFNGEADDLPANATFTVQQGFLEQSNVDSLRTMTDMMQAYRMFETNQRVLKAYDESMGKAVNEIGRIG